MLNKVLITGGTGFIGATLARALARDGVKVLALAREGSDTHALEQVGPDLRVCRHDGSTSQLVDLLRAEKPQMVFHLASHFLVDHQPADVESLVRSNVLLGAQLAEAMCIAGCARLVNVGTVWQHYQSSAYRPVNLYAATKQAFEDILAYYHDARGLSCVTLKLADTYGPADPRKKVLPLLLRLLETGEALDMSPGDQQLNLIHVDDVVAGLRRAGDMLLEQDAPVLASYFLPGDTLTLKQLVARIESLAGRALHINWGGRPYRAREVMSPSIDSAMILPGWAPGISLDEGIGRLLTLRSRCG